MSSALRSKEKWCFCRICMVRRQTNSRSACLQFIKKSPAHEDVVRRALGCSGVGCVFSSFIAHLAEKLLLVLAQMGGQLHIVGDDEVAVGAIGLLVTFAAKADLGSVLRFRFHF